MKHWNMNVDTKTKVPLKFDGLETLCVDEKTKSYWNFHIADICEAYTLSDM